MDGRRRTAPTEVTTVPTAPAFIAPGDESTLPETRSTSMRLHPAFIVVIGLAVAPASLMAGGGDFKVAATGATRELSNQLFCFQNTISLIPGPPMGRGLYKQCDNVMGDLIYFQQQLKRNVSREQLLI